LGSGLVGVFLNLFFLANDSYFAVLVFQGATYLAALVAYLLAGYALLRLRPQYLYLAGLLLFALVLVDLLAASGPLSNALLFGVLWGAATGVFYGGNNPMMHDITRSANRTSFVAVNNLLTGLVGLVAPVAAGALIQFSTYRGPERYLWDFVVTGAFFLAAAIVVRRVRYEAPRPGRYSLRAAFHGPGPKYRRFQLVFAVSQMFSIPFGIILPIYVFQRTGSYLLTGAFASYVVLLSVVANLVFRHGFRREGRFAAVAVVGIVASSLILVTGWDPPWDAFAFAGVYTVLATPLNNRVMVQFMEWIDAGPGVDRALAWSNRELYLGIGRITILGVMLAFSGYLLRRPADLVLLLPLLSLYAVAYLGLFDADLGGPRSTDSVRARPE